MVSQQIMQPDFTNGLQREMTKEMAQETTIWSIWPWKQAIRALQQGEKRLVPVGLGDDEQCIEDDFTAWKELVWLELDQLLHEEDGTSITTPYTAAILEYRVVYHDKPDPSAEDQTHANGHAVHDAQHPCNQMWLSKRNCIPLNLTGLALI